MEVGVRRPVHNKAVFQLGSTNLFVTFKDIATFDGAELLVESRVSAVVSTGG